MNPKDPTDPSWNAFTTPPKGIPAAVPGRGHCDQSNEGVQLEARDEYDHATTATNA